MSPVLEVSAVTTDRLSCAATGAELNGLGTCLYSLGRASGWCESIAVLMRMGPASLP